MRFVRIVNVNIVLGHPTSIVLDKSAGRNNSHRDNEKQKIFSPGKKTMGHVTHKIFPRVFVQVHCIIIYRSKF